MSKGHPDYFGLPVFPKYGHVESVLEAATPILAGANAYLFGITGQVRILGGLIYVVGTNDFDNLSMGPELDGAIVYMQTGLTMLLLGFTERSVPPTYLTILDKVAGAWGFGITEDFTLVDSLRIFIENSTADDVSVTGYIAYHDLIL